MRKIISFALLLSFASFASAQTINASLVPQVVKNKMQEKYPEAKGLYWRQSDAGFVEANFTDDGKKCNTIFLTTGGWVSTDCEITAEEFPAAATTYLSDPKNADKVTKYYQSDTKAKGKQFSADVKKAGKSLQYIFDGEGNLIMKGPKN
ncbi:MAG: hypothetical protein ABIO46_13465 [Chitinophagales bacterium]